MNVYLVEGELYCENCPPPGEEYADCYGDGGGESDCPQHCAECSQPLDNPLTGDGVEYVLEAILEAYDEPESDRNRIMPLKGTAEETATYYHGSRHVAIVRDWAIQISNYSLDRREQFIVDRFLELTSLDRPGVND